MPLIGNVINGVSVRYGPGVNQNVDPRVIEGLRRVIKPNIADGHVLSEIYISSANDQHELPSRHVLGGGKAVDISRIYGMRMAVFYTMNASVKAIVDAIQTAFETYTYRRESFGPFFKKKLGAPMSIGGHLDHIHLSVN